MSDLPTPPLTYRRDLDGLRGVAVLAVVLFHVTSSWMPGGYVGVDVFFVISGYLITSLCVAEAGRGTFSLSTFYARRARRLLPALLTVLLFVLAFGWWTLNASDLTSVARQVVASVCFVPNVLFWQDAGYFDVAAAKKPLLHLWSLGVEEQFYLVWPAWIAWSTARGGRPIRAAAALMVASFGLALGRAAGHPAEAFYLPHTRLWEPLAGGVLALSPSSWPRRSPRWDDAASIVGLLAILVACVAVDATATDPGVTTLLPVVGALALIGAGPDAIANRAILGGRALVAVGLISYPLYLWHWPLLSFRRILQPAEVGAASQDLALVVLAAALATTTWAWVERPVRTSLAKRGATVPTLLAALTLLGAVAALAAEGLVRPHGEDVWQRSIADALERCPGVTIRSCRAASFTSIPRSRAAAPRAEIERASTRWSCGATRTRWRGRAHGSSSARSGTCGCTRSRTAGARPCWTCGTRRRTPGWGLSVGHWGLVRRSSRPSARCRPSAWS